MLDVPGRVGFAAPTSLQTHHFVLPSGTLVGTGTGSHGETADAFVVVGGTGSFSGARGTYTALQRHLGLGGDGSGTYRLDLLDLPTHLTAEGA